MRLPKWYSIGIMILYSVLVFEYGATVLRQIPIRDLLNSNLFIVISKIGLLVSVSWSIFSWIILSFIFHLAALIFNGKSRFDQFLYINSYPYVIPMIMILISILILDRMHFPNTNNVEKIEELLISNFYFNVAVKLINMSFAIYYIVIVWIIHHLYNIKYLYAILSVAIPLFSIWCITAFIKLI